MDDKDINAALSALNQMDADARTQASLQQGRDKARMVLTVFQAAQEALRTLEYTRGILEDQLEQIKGASRNEQEASDRQIERIRKAHNDAIAEMDADIEKKKVSVADITERFKSAQNKFDRATAKMDEEIAAKQTELNSLTADLEGLKAAHGLK